MYTRERTTKFDGDLSKLIDMELHMGSLRLLTSVKALMSDEDIYTMVVQASASS